MYYIFIGLTSLLSNGHSDTMEQMIEFGHHLHNSIKLFDLLFHHGSASPLADTTFETLSELLGTTAELWPRFLPSEIDAIARSGFTVSYTPQLG
jgi:hypothetical protein